MVTGQSVVLYSQLHLIVRDGGNSMGLDTDHRRRFLLP
jgi:hypothetical protein